MVGWLACLARPDLYRKHPEYFIETGPDVYEELRALTTTDDRPPTETIVGNTRLAIKRDPVSRFLSGFKNRVLQHRKCDTTDISEFLDNFEEISGRNKDIATHFRPQYSYLGKDPSVYTHVFDLKEIDQVKVLLEDLFERDLPPIRLQRSKGPKVDLTEAQVRRVKEIYKGDYKYGWC